MTKQELMKKYQEIILKTNGSNDDYVNALFQIGVLILQIDDTEQKDQHIAELEKQVAKYESVNWENGMTEAVIEKNKELEEENRLLKNQVIEYKNRFDYRTAEVDYWKQQLHELPKKICDKIFEQCDTKFENAEDFTYVRMEVIEEILQIIQSKYENEIR